MKIFKFIFIIILVFSTTLQANLINLNSAIKSDFSKDEIINAQDFILSNTYGLKFRESGAEFGKEFDAFRPDDHDFYSDYNPNAIGALEDNSLFFVPVGRIAQGASGAIIRTTSGVFGRVAGSIGNKIETNALTKITENLPKNAVYNAETKLINYKGKDYAVAGIDSVSGQPIFGQVLNGKLTGNYTMFVNNGAVRVPKPTMSVMGNNYQFGNFVRDPRTILGGAVVGDVIYGYVSPEPANNGFQAIGGIINKIENKIKEENNKQ